MDKTKSNNNFLSIIIGIMVCGLIAFLGIGFGVYKLNIEIQSRADQEANLIIGLWQGTEVKDLSIKIQQNSDKDHCYISVQASDNDINSYKGETVLEFCYDFGKKQYIGRHLWGGGKSGTTSWGQDGGVIIELRDDATLFMRFLDSIYSSGWILRRVK